MDGLHEMFNQTALLGELTADFRRAVLPVTILIAAGNVLALFGNSFVLYGFTFRYPRCTYRSLIIFLAFVDLSSCFTTMPAEIFTQMFWFKFPSLSICKMKSFFNVFTLSIEILLLLIIAVDRYKQTCVPQSTQISSGLAAYLFFGSVLTAAGLAVPAAVGFGEHKYVYEYNGVNISVVSCGLTDEYSRGYFSVVYSICLQTTACLSLAAMFVIYLIIMKSVVSRRKNRELKSETTPLVKTDWDDQTSVNQRAVQMFVVALLFILTTLACRIIGFIVNSKVPKLSIKSTVIINFFFRLYFINHVVHPVIYGILDPKFRETMKFICCKCFQKT